MTISAAISVLAFLFLLFYVSSSAQSVLYVEERDVLAVDVQEQGCSRRDLVRARHPFKFGYVNPLRRPSSVGSAAELGSFALRSQLLAFPASKVSLRENSHWPPSGPRMRRGFDSRLTRKNAGTTTGIKPAMRNRSFVKSECYQRTQFPLAHLQPSNEVQGPRWFADAA